MILENVFNILALELRAAVKEPFALNCFMLQLQYPQYDPPGVCLSTQSLYTSKRPDLISVQFKLRKAKSRSL